MKKLSQNTEQFDTIKSKLDQAIDQMDIQEIEKQLSILSEGNPLPDRVEDSKRFAKKIMKKNKKGNGFMQKRYKKFGTIAACMSLVICLGVTAVYAAGLLKEFTFYNKDTTVTIVTDENISEEEAKKLADEAGRSYGEPIDQGVSVPVENNFFSSINEIKENFGVDIVVPSYIPEDFERDDNIQTQKAVYTNNIYVTYTSSENSERRFGITVIKWELPNDDTSFSIASATDSVYRDIYTTPSGNEYTMFDEDGGVIAQTKINNIEYALCFMGVSEDEMHKVIDSVDLSKYEQ